MQNFRALEALSSDPQSLAAGGEAPRPPKQPPIANFWLRAWLQNCNVLTMMHYVHCFRNINNQSTAICRPIFSVDIEVEYFYDNIVYHHPTLVCIFL